MGWARCSEDDNTFLLPTDGCSKIIGGEMRYVIPWYLQSKYRNHEIISKHISQPKQQVQPNQIIVYYDSIDHKKLYGGIGYSPAVIVDIVREIHFPNGQVMNGTTNTTFLFNRKYLWIFLLIVVVSLLSTSSSCIGYMMTRRF